MSNIKITNSLAMSIQKLNKDNENSNSENSNLTKEVIDFLSVKKQTSTKNKEKSESIRDLNDFKLEIQDSKKDKDIEPSNILTYCNDDNNVQLYGLSIQTVNLDYNPLIAVSSVQNLIDSNGKKGYLNLEKNYNQSNNNNNTNNNKNSSNSKNYKEYLPDKANNYFSLLSIEECFCDKQDGEELNEKYFNLINRYNHINLDFSLSKIMFSPNQPDLIATTDTNISIYKINTNIIDEEQEHTKRLGFKEKYKNIKDNSIYTTDKSTNISCDKIVLNDIVDNPAPLTSFDWNKYKHSLLVTSSYDTTCTIWDIDKGKIVTRLIAHDKEVYDVCFLNNENVFISCGADSSIRLFDLRDLDTSNILFEANETTALTRISFSYQNDNYLLSTPIDKPFFYVIDLRDTTSPLEIVQKHSSIVNCIKWSKEEDNTFISASDDGSLFVWELNNIHSHTPKYEYCDKVSFSPINNVDWKDGLVAINSYNKLKLVKY